MKSRKPLSSKQHSGSVRMPGGAVSINPEKINTGSWAATEIPLWYEDIHFTCRDCKEPDVWTARQQKWWYEVAGATFYKTAVSCRACRKAKRLKDAAAARRTHEFRLARAEKRAAAMSAKLAAADPGAFAVLTQPVTGLLLSKNTRAVLDANHIKTIGDLVACDPSCSPPGLFPGDWTNLNHQLKRLGLSLIGARLAHPPA